MEIRIVAPFTIKTEYVEALKQSLNDVISASRKEPGCLQYDLQLEIGSTNSFVFFERWRSQEDIDLHEKSAHFQQFIAALDGKIEHIEIKKLKLIA